MLATPKADLPRRFSAYLPLKHRLFLRELATGEGSTNAVLRRLIEAEMKRLDEACRGKQAAQSG